MRRWKTHSGDLKWPFKGNFVWKLLKKGGDRSTAKQGEVLYHTKGTEQIWGGRQYNSVSPDIWKSVLHHSVRAKRCVQENNFGGTEKEGPFGKRGQQQCDNKRRIYIFNKGGLLHLPGNTRASNNTPKGRLFKNDQRALSPKERIFTKESRSRPQSLDVATHSTYKWGVSTTTGIYTPSTQR